MTHDTSAAAGGSSAEGATPPSSPWASPGGEWPAHSQEPAAATDSTGHTGPDTAPLPQNGEAHPGYAAQTPPAYPYGAPYGYGPDPSLAATSPGMEHDPHGAPMGPIGPEAPGSSADPARRRGPGWIGVITAAVIAAVLFSAAGVLVAHHVDRTVGTPVTLGGSGSGSGSGGSSGSVAQVPSGAAVDWHAVATRVEPSVVTIEVQSSTVEGEGTGIILDTSGHVLTNNHVATAAGANGKIRIILSDGRVYTGSIAGTDSQTDLAVLQIQKAPADLKPATFGDSSKVAVGEQVMAVGNPLGLSDTVTTGIVSATDRPVSTQAEEAPSGGSSANDPFGLDQQQTPSTSDTVITNAIQTDAAINPGNSGGPLVNAAGQVIGINSSIASTSDDTSSQSGSIGLGFAIPSQEAQRVTSELVANGKATHAQLGVSLQGSDGTATVSGTTYQAAIVAAVTSGGAADKAGIKAGDAITAVDGKSVPGYESLTAQVHSRAPGDTVTLTVVRGGQASQVKVQLGTKSS